MPLLVCPNCNCGMTAVLRSGVEIDVCPQCRGVWLDRGELETLLQRPTPSDAATTFLPASAWGQPGPAAVAPVPTAEYHHDRHDRHDGQDHHGQRHKGWKGLFNVFD